MPTTMKPLIQKTPLFTAAMPEKGRGKNGRVSIQGISAAGPISFPEYSMKTTPLFIKKQESRLGAFEGEDGEQGVGKKPQLRARENHILSGTVNEKRLES